LPEVYNATREEHPNRVEEECWEESDESGNVQPLERRKPRVPLTSAKEAANRICATVVFREPPFKGHGVDTGTETDGEARAPKGIHRDRNAGGFLGDGRVGYNR